MSDDVFSSVESVRELTKVSIYQMLDHETEELPRFPYTFKDFPDSNKLNFGLNIGTVISFIMTEARHRQANIDIVQAGILDAMQDIHDDLKVRYLKL